MNEYEISGIEILARGVCVVDGKVLLCRPKSGGYTYLPGGHVEFGETSREALVREMAEETGQAAKAGELLGVVESQFKQHGKKHCEISLVYRMNLVVCPHSGERGLSPARPGVCPHDEPRGLSPTPPVVKSQEEWIDFDWLPIAKLDEANLLPPEMKRIVASSVGSVPTAGLGSVPM